MCFDWSWFDVSAQAHWGAGHHSSHAALCRLVWRRHAGFNGQSQSFMYFIYGIFFISLLSWATDTATNIFFLSELSVVRRRVIHVYCLFRLNQFQQHFIQMHVVWTFSFVLAWSYFVNLGMRFFTQLSEITFFFNGRMCGVIYWEE